MIVLIPIGSRSDAPLSAGLLIQLEADPNIEYHTYNLKANDDNESYNITQHFITLHKPDLIVCFGDRVEMFGAARAALYNQVKIAHVYAGVVADTKRCTYDEMIRHCITLMADYAFCEDEGAVLIVDQLWTTIGKISDKDDDYWDHVHNVGITHMDAVTVDESAVPRYRYCDKCEILRDCKEPNGIGCISAYNLVLYNPTTGYNAKKKMMADWRDIIIFTAKMPNKPSIPTIFVKPNRDYSHIEHKNAFTDAIAFQEFTHAQFLGLLKHCKDFITNSSAGYYEAPFYLTEEHIVWAGDRNDLRHDYKKLETGASAKIAEVIGKL